MKLESQRVLITGAGGGIGRSLCARLATRKARLCLLDRDPHSFATLALELEALGADILTFKADVTRSDDRQRAIAEVINAWGGIDVLVNLAGVLDFARFDEQDPGMLQRILQVNVEAPLHLTRGVLPHMLDQGHGRIVNIGSMFGSIGFPCFAAYSASKFALRGFSQALRRELAGSGVGVTYVSPRAVKTAFNPPVVHLMAERGMMHMDDPDRVVKAIVRGVEKDRDEVYIGFPESLFARINGVLPGVVSRAIVRQVPSLVAFAEQSRA